MLVGDSHISLNTFWGYIGMAIFELRIKNLLITGPTTIKLDIDQNNNIPILVTINAEEGISADEFTIVGYFSFYGLMVDPRYH